MSTEKTISVDALRTQVEAYREAKANGYDCYADALERILKKASAVSLPEAIVQTRAKSVDSFAEKCVRKYGKYKNGVQSMTDLCGARIVVHTLAQVEAVRVFVKCNFKVLEEDEKGLMLGRDTFGYRDLHFLIRLDPERAGVIGFTPDEIATIGEKTAELQVRTVVQHAWADILHDRMYKTKLIYPPAFQRQGSLLAAIMEDGDRQFDALADDIDGMLTNFSVYASREEVEKEMAVQGVIHENARPEKKPMAALGLARLYAAQGLYDLVCTVLEPHKDVPGPLRFEILLELGFACCKVNAAAPSSRAYHEGQQDLQAVINECRREMFDSIPNTRKRKSMLARALTRLAWSYERVQGAAFKARSSYREALVEEPGNPYYLSEVLGFERVCAPNTDIAGTMAFAIREAIATCREHAANGVERPYACFTAGRLLLLLDCHEEALVEYAHGMRHLKAGHVCVPPDVVEQEEAWIYRASGPKAPDKGFQWVLQLIALYGGNTIAGDPLKATKPLTPPVLIVAGSAGIGISDEAVNRLIGILRVAVSGRGGCIISGGTQVGVPKCISEAIAAAAADGHAVPELLGYLPRSLPTGVEADKRCCQVICGDKDFSPAQLLCYWNDILASGMDAGDVVLLGYGGGGISAAEYAIALMLGARVYLVRGSGRAADAFLKMEQDIPNLKGLPDDPASIQALFWTASSPTEGLSAAAIETMARAFHANYVSENAGKIPENMRPWDELGETYIRANTEQARHAITILNRCGYEVVPLSDPGTPITAADLAPDIETLSELEHGRWNCDRLAAGWRLGERDNDRKLHDCLVPWSQLPDQTREWDRIAIRKYPEILGGIGMKIVRGTACPPGAAGS